MVNLHTQRLFFFRNGTAIAASTISSGKTGNETPTGVFTILQKREKHFSKTYNNAPMPNMQRLTWQGIALHAGNLPGYPASHGCIRLPLQFSKLLFGETTLGMTVVITSHPEFPHDQPLIITDAAVNIAPDLKAKVDITQNAIDLAHALGAKEVRVAILSAMESVNPDVPSTLEAAALCKMADRGQITGAEVDGPLALDNAISLEAATIKKIASPVAGRANVLVVPDLEAGNMLAKSLSFLADADAAGIVLGAKVPIILTSRADEEMARLASCAVAQLLVAARKSAPSSAIL